MRRNEEAYLYLQNAIISNQLSPGQAISELDIAAALQMSRSPIREALRRLETEGLVVSYPARGSFVTALSSGDVEEIYALRVLLEVWALERSINRIPDSVLDEIERLFQDTRQEEDWERRHLADRKLHGAIVEYAGSRRLIEFVDILNYQIERIRRLSAKDGKRNTSSYHEHKEILRFLRERDLPKAKDALTRHLRGVADSAIEAVKFDLG